MDIIVSLLFAGLVGGAIGGLFHLLQKYTVNKLPHKDRDKEWAYEPEQRRDFVFLGEQESVFREVVAAVSLVKGAKIKKADTDNGVLRAKTGINWKTFGDAIKIKVRPCDHTSVNVQIESKPWVWGTGVDYGKNFDNAETIAAHLMSKFRRLK